MDSVSLDYLTRIGCADVPRDHSLATLERLIAGHLRAIRYSNEALLQAVVDHTVPSALASVELTHELVTRGGYCFQQISQQVHALRALDFRVTRHPAASIAGRPIDEAAFLAGEMPLTHEVLVVHGVEGLTRLVDVGYSQNALSGALLVDLTCADEDAVLACGADTYRLRRVAGAPEWRELQVHMEGESSWVVLYRFPLSGCDDVAALELNRLLVTTPKPVRRERGLFPRAFTAEGEGSDSRRMRSGVAGSGRHAAVDEGVCGSCRVARRPWRCGD